MRRLFGNTAPSRPYLMAMALLMVLFATTATREPGACNTAKPLPKITNQMSQSLLYFSRPSVSNHLTTDKTIPTNQHLS